MTPTWYAIYDEEGNALNAPTGVLEVGGGLYEFEPIALDKEWAALIFFGSPAVGPYQFVKTRGARIFPIFDADGNPVTGASPTWETHRDADGNAVAGPAFTALGHGLYYTNLAPYHSGIVDTVTGTPRRLALTGVPASPTVTVVSPAPGATLRPTDEVIVKVTDDGWLSFVELTVRYPGAATEVIVRNDTFRTPYTGSRSDVEGGYLYRMRRDGGWPKGTPSFEAVAVDTYGKVT
jgi:hypothetical protein